MGQNEEKKYNNFVYEELNVYFSLVFLFFFIVFYVYDGGL